MKLLNERSRPWVLMGLGALLTAACFLLLWAQPRGQHEFAYLPHPPEMLPWTAMRGFTWEQAHSHLYRLLLLGPGLVLLSLGLSSFWRPALPDPHFFRRAALAGGAFCVVAMSIVMLAVLRGRAIVDDELTYSMQAGALARGKLSLPDVGFVWYDLFSVKTLGGYTGKYMPGAPALQIPGVLLGIPALVHVPLTALTLWLWHSTLRFRFEPRTAALATLLVALSPMLVLTGATGLSHLPALFFVVLGAYGYELTRTGRVWLGPALVSAAFALCFLVRPQVALPANGTLGLAAAWQLLRQRKYASLAIALTGPAALGMGLVAAYNHALSGSWKTLPWFLQCGAEHYGFRRVWLCDAYEHTPVRALENLAVVAARFNGFWLGLPLSLALLAPVFVPRPFASRFSNIAIWLLVGAAVLAFQFGYYSPGVSDTGPVYHFELLLPASVLGALTLEALWARFPSVAPALLLVHLALGTSSFYFEHVARIARAVEIIHGPLDDVLARIDRPALLIHEHRDSEILRLGWITNGFPKRFRNPDDPVVTVPRLPPKELARAFAAYPGRSCYYFHRRELTGEPELLKCADAQAYLSRGWLDEDPESAAGLWVAPTAYIKTDFNPHGARRRRNQGQKCVLCCSVQALEAAGYSVTPDYLPCLDGR